jgi:hypothetical protein
MNESLKKVLYITAALYFLVSIIGGAILQSRLERTRQELNTVRMELSAATNRQSELADILRRDGEILRESSTTISGIRSQIAAIRESYMAMENLLYNTGSNDSTDNNITNYTKLGETK